MQYSEITENGRDYLVCPSCNRRVFFKDKGKWLFDYLSEDEYIKKEWIKTLNFPLCDFHNDVKNLNPES